MCFNKLFFKLKDKYPSTRFSHEDILKVVNKNTNKIVELNGTAGTLILVDTSHIHRGKPLLENERYALTNFFYPKKYSQIMKTIFNLC